MSWRLDLGSDHWPGGQTLQVTVDAVQRSAQARKGLYRVLEARGFTVSRT